MPKELNIEVVLKLVMIKARVNKGCMYAFGGLITRLCHAADIPNVSLDKWHQYFQHHRCHKDKWAQQLVNPNTHYRGVP